MGEKSCPLLFALVPLHSFPSVRPQELRVTSFCPSPGAAGRLIENSVLEEGKRTLLPFLGFLKAAETVPGKASENPDRKEIF